MNNRLMPIVIATLVAMVLGIDQWRDTSSKTFSCTRRWFYEGHQRVFECGDGRCYTEEARCDSVRDCSNFADEMNCDADGKWKTTCDEIENDSKGLGFFQCANQMCIYGCQRCDGVFEDCTDGSDETVGHGQCNDATYTDFPSSSACLNFKRR